MCIDIINDLLEVEKLPTLHIDRYRNIFTIPVENYYREIGFDFEKESFQIVGRRWMDQYESRKYVDAAVNPNSKALIEKVNGAGINQSVLSAYPQNTLDELVGHYNLKEFFDHVVGAGDIYAYGKVDE